MDISPYQAFKAPILALFHLSKDAVHVHIGLMVLFVYVVIFKKTINSLRAIIPPVLIASVMEVLDLIDDKNSLGYFRWMSSLHDILNTLFWPLAIILLFKFGLVRSR